MILGYVNMRYAGLEEGELKISHFFPVNNFCVEVEAKFINQDLDVVDGELGVPATIHVDISGRNPNSVTAICSM